MNRIRTFLKGEEGIAVTEYGLLIALVAILLIGVVTLFGSQISSWFQAKTSTITSV
jgi:pilus assembly protein Flp/PilA